MFHISVGCFLGLVLIFQYHEHHPVRFLSKESFGLTWISRGSIKWHFRCQCVCSATTLRAPNRVIPIPPFQKYLLSGISTSATPTPIKISLTPKKSRCRYFHSHFVKLIQNILGHVLCLPFQFMMWITSWFGDVLGPPHGKERDALQSWKDYRDRWWMLPFEYEISDWNKTDY